MKKLTAFLAAVALIGCSANIYMPSAEAMNTITLQDYSEQSKAEAAEKPDLEADCKSVTEGDFTFNVYEDFAFLTDYADRDAEEVEIPTEINGVPVIGVDGSPFGYCRKLKTIVFPDSLQYFNWFDLVAAIETVSSPSTGSNNISSSVSVSTSIIEINEDTTFNPAHISIMSDEDDTIYPTIEEVVVSETNPYFTVADGILYSKDMKKVIGCPPALEMTELKISEKAEIINDYAFAACYKLKNAVIPENIKQVNNAAFAACINLESVELPKSINAIYMDTFYLCESLADVKFNGDISAIGAGAFAECSSLEEFDIPDTVTYIGANAFADSACAENVDGIFYVDNWAVDNDEKSKLEKVIFRDGTIGVAEMTFALQSAELKYVDFPESVIYVGDMAVAGSGDYPNEIHYRAPYLNERTLGASKGTSDFYIYDKDCDIFDSEKTIPAEYKIKEKMPVLESDGVFTSVWGDIAGEAVEEPEESIDKSVVIHGYAGSTAQAYAEKYNRKFEVIEEDVAEAVAGDANGDGKFTIADAVILQKWILGSSDSTLENPEAVDFCKDGNIDVFDFCLMRDAMVKGL